MAPPPTPAPSFPDDRNPWWQIVFCSPILWGVALTVAFYAAVPWLPIERAFVMRYFCGHWIEYATTGLFFVGVAILGFKAIRIPNEREAFGFHLFRDPRMTAATDVGERTALLVQSLTALPVHLRRTALVRRYRDVCEYIHAQKSTDRVEDHLKYLADVAGETLSDSYALIRTVTWAIPILGFLGTVIGITMAIANITPEQLETSLPEVTAGLAVAFDTTALSLSLSMALVFAAFVVERSEQQILVRVEAVGVRDIGPAFPPTQEQSPLAQAESRAAEQLLTRTESLIGWQTELWQQSLEGLRQRWAQSVEEQQSEFKTALQSGMAATLGDHHQQLAAIRREMLDACQTQTQETLQLVNELQQQGRRQAAEQQQQSTAFWERAEQTAAALREEHRKQSAEQQQLATGFWERAEQSTLALRNDQREQAAAWRAGLEELGARIQTASESAAAESRAHLDQLRQQADLLLRIVSSEEELARLQRTLADNLTTLRGLDAFEETLHSLTAAVHLLTMRHRAAA